MPKTVKMSASDIDRRAEQAEGFLRAGSQILKLWGKPEEQFSEGTVATVVGSIVILSGIAAADVICGIRYGERNNSGSHKEAALLLQRKLGDGRAVDQEPARLLLLLLDVKSQVQYSATFTSLDKAKQLGQIATDLFQLMRKELRARP